MRNNKLKGLQIMKSILILTLFTFSFNLIGQDPDPKATVGSYTSGTIKRSDLLAVEKILPNKSKLVIVNFTISYPIGDDDLVELVSKTDAITKEMKDDFKKVKAGTEISFENIKGKMADKTVILESVVLKVVD
jgi:hypothetical protein